MPGTPEAHPCPMARSSSIRSISMHILKHDGSPRAAFATEQQEGPGHTPTRQRATGAVRAGFRARTGGRSERGGSALPRIGRRPRTTTRRAALRHRPALARRRPRPARRQRPGPMPSPPNPRSRRPPPRPNHRHVSQPGTFRRVAGAVAAVLLRAGRRDVPCAEPAGADGVQSGVQAVEATARSFTRFGAVSRLRGALVNHWIPSGAVFSRTADSPSAASAEQPPNSTIGTSREG
ncbi:hypothetical protein EDD99_3225 [Streptomyces sp. 846.5]|nr:hypothetical protein EDD99_3225 [Streptomyces sp. 846.5]